MTVRQYAKHRGISRQAVEYALARGRIQRETDGLIDVENADRTWQATTNVRNSIAGRTAKLRLGSRIGTERNPNQFGDRVGQARAVREIYDAKLAKLRHDEAKGLLVPANTVQTDTFKRFKILRDACFNIPNRLSAQIAAQPDPDVVGELLDNELRLVFSFSGF